MRSWLNWGQFTMEIYQELLEVVINGVTWLLKLIFRPSCKKWTKWCDTKVGNSGGAMLSWNLWQKNKSVTVIGLIIVKEIKLPKPGSLARTHGFAECVLVIRKLEVCWWWGQSGISGNSARLNLSIQLHLKSTCTVFLLKIRRFFQPFRFACRNY